MMGFQLVRNKYIVLYYIMSKSSEKVVINENSPGRAPLNPTGKISPNIPNNKPQHPKPRYIDFFAKKNRKKNPSQGIGPFIVDTTKKPYTVKRPPHNTPTEYRGVDAFNDKIVHPLTHSSIVSKHINRQEGIGPFIVDTTKKPYTVKRPPHNTPTEYRGVDAFNDKIVHPLTHSSIVSKHINPPQGIGPFRVDTTKKANTVKRTSPTRKTTYRGVNAFSFKNVHSLTDSPIVSNHITSGVQTTHINPEITRTNLGTPFVYKSATGNNPSNENNKKTTRSLSNSKTRKKTSIKTSIKRRAKSI